MNEEQRAQLLERAVEVLGREEAGHGKAQSRSRRKR
jgi:hypothetical protein